MLDWLGIARLGKQAAMARDRTEQKRNNDDSDDVAHESTSYGNRRIGRGSRFLPSRPREGALISAQRKFTGNEASSRAKALCGKGLSRDTGALPSVLASRVREQPVDPQHLHETLSYRRLARVDRGHARRGTRLGTREHQIELLHLAQSLAQPFQHQFRSGRSQGRESIGRLELYVVRLGPCVE